MKRFDELQCLVVGLQFVLRTVVGECYTYRPQHPTTTTASEAGKKSDSKHQNNDHDSDKEKEKRKRRSQRRRRQQQEEQGGDKDGHNYKSTYNENYGNFVGVVVEQDS
ncbi:hypothetical protein ACA910_017641 [Epithemia clementina (nom. ined.)]